MIFDIGDTVKLKDGDGRHHVIESFMETSFRYSVHIDVFFKDRTAIGHIEIGPSGTYTDMIKI